MKKTYYEVKYARDGWEEGEFQTSKFDYESDAIAATNSLQNQPNVLFVTMSEVKMHTKLIHAYQRG